jgi:hypothetical protein
MAGIGSVFTEKQALRVFLVGPIGGIGIKRGHRCCSESVKSGTLNINFV